MSSPVQSTALVSFEGHDYRLEHPRSFGCEDEFVGWLEARACAKVEQLYPRMRGMLGEQAAALWLASARRETLLAVDTGEFAWDTPACRAALFRPDGLREMAFLQFAAANPQSGLDRMLVERMLKDPACEARLMALIWGVGPDGKPLEGADPNAARPEQDSGSTTTSVPSSKSAATAESKSSS